MTPLTAPGSGTRLALAGSLFGSVSTASSRSDRASATGQPAAPPGNTGVTWTESASGSGGAETSTGAPPSTHEPAERAVVLEARLIARGSGVNGHVRSLEPGERH